MRNHAMCLAMLAVLLSGCGEPSRVADTAEVEANSTSFRSMSPADYLNAIFRRYRNAASYQDQGVVRLSYTVDGRVESQLAPSRIWLDHGQLYIEAYDVALWSDKRAVTAWISDPATDNFDSQVLRLPPLDERPTVQSLFADPVLAQKVAAGLAGPPPQLEWLFTEEPMKPLFHGGLEFEFGSTESIDDARCRSVRVKAGADLYRFWVDERAGLIRRVDLPSINAPPNQGEPSQPMTLQLELRRASFDAPRSQPDLKPLPAKPKLVRQLVPIPPPGPPESLGTRPSPFRLQSRDPSIEFTERGSDREVTIWVRFSGDQASVTSLQAMDQFSATMPDSWRGRVRVAALVDREAARRVPSNLRLAVAQDADGSAARALRLEPGALLIMDRRGTVAWNQPLVSTSELAGLGAITNDVLGGVDVPERFRDQWNDQLAAYRRALEKQSVPAN